MRLINTIEIDTSNPKLNRLTIIKERTWLVDINTINDDELVEILKGRLEDVELDDFKDQVGPINGGIALAIDQEVRIVPMCCGDIGNITEWEEIPDTEPGQWKQLWLGHPWIYFRTEEHTIAFSDYCETTPDQDIQPLLTISSADFLREIERIRTEQDHFEKRIEQALIRMGLDNCEQMAQQMTGW